MKKPCPIKIINILIQTLFIIIFTTAQVNAQFSGGNGSVTDPYQISNTTDLQFLSNNETYWGNHFVLTSDIDASDSRNWNIKDNDTLGLNPIGDVEYQGARQQIPFTGSFDGNYHTISNLFIHVENELYVGLFGSTNNAVIKNLTLSHIDITGYMYIGGLIGLCNETSVKNCSVNGLLTAQDGPAGMLIGTSSYSTVHFCSAKGKIDCPGFVGGLIGSNENSILKHSYSSVDLGGDVTGSLVSGNSYKTSLIENCLSTGSVNGSFVIGSLIGYNSGGQIKNTYATGKINGTSYTSGHTGINSLGIISSSFFDTAFTGQTQGIGSDDNNQYVVGLDTKDFKNTSLFLSAGWDFEHTWELTTVPDIDSNPRPYLRMMLHDFFVSVNLTIDNSATITGESFYDLNDEVTLTVRPDSGYKFIAWQLNGKDISTQNTISFKCPGNAEYTAVIIEDAGFEGGRGTKDDPFQIASIEQLTAINTVPDLFQKHFILICDIDASGTKNWNDGKGFKPLGYHNDFSDNNDFKGSLNGQGHIINNLYINRPDEDYVGLFAFIDEGCISNLGIANCDITGKQYVGAIAGFTYGSGDNSKYAISNCFTSGKIEGTSTYVGGLVGFNRFGRLVSGYSTATVKGNSITGGLIGECVGNGVSTNLENSYASGLINSKNGYALIGYISGGIIKNCCFDSITTNKNSTSFGYNDANVIKLSTEQFADSAFMQSTVGFDFNSDWKMAVCHNGYKRPVLKWENLHHIDILTSPLNTGNSIFNCDTAFNLVHGGNFRNITVLPDSVSKFIQWDSEQGSLLTHENPTSLSNILHDTALYARVLKNTGTYTATFVVSDNSTNILPGETLCFDGNYYITDKNGKAAICGLSNGKYAYSISKEGNVGVSDTLTISGTDVTVPVRLDIIINTLTFIVAHNGIPVENALIVTKHTTFPEESYHYATDKYGRAYDYNFLNFGFTYEVIADGFQSYSGSFLMQDTDVTNQIELKSMRDVNLTVTDGTTPIANASVYVNDTIYTSDATGTISITNVLEGAHNYTVIAAGYTSIENSFTVDTTDIHDTLTLNIPQEPTYNAIVTLKSGNIIITSLAVFVCNGKAYRPNANGKILVLNLSPGTYIFTVYQLMGTTYYGKFIISNSNEYFTVDLSTSSSPFYTATFNVNDGISPIAGAIITQNGNVYVTDENGNAPITGLHNGTYNFTITAGGFEDTTSAFTISDGNLDENITMLANPAQTFTASLGISDGINAIENACVVFDETTYYTHVNGSVVVTGLTSGTYSYTISATGYDTLSGICIVRDSDKNENIILAESTYRVTFVVNNGNYPLSNASIIFNGQPYSVGPNGQLTIQHVLNGTYAYKVGAFCYDSLSGSILVNLADTGDTISLQESTYSLSFSVTDGTNPIENATVFFNGMTYTTNVYGKINLTGIHNGSYSYLVSASGYNNTNGTVAITGNNVNKTIALQNNTTPTYSITFYISDNYNPLANASINFDGTYYLTDASGNATISGISKGTYNYLVSAQGYNDYSGTIVVSDANLTESIILSTTPAPTFSVTFSITDGENAIKGASISFNDSTYTTNEKGVVIIEHVANGTYNYLVSVQGYDDYSGTVMVSDANLTESIILSTTPAPTFSVTFSITDGENAIKGASILFNDSIYTTNENGEITISGISDGTYNYEVSVDGYKKYNGSITVSGANLTEFVSLLLSSFSTQNNDNQYIINYYPNPVKDQLIMELPENHKYSIFEIYDLTGNLVCKIKNNGNPIIKINLSEYSGNVYFIKVIDNNKIIDVHKILKD